MSVHITMATTPARSGHALRVAQQLRPQCDRLTVYVNGRIDADRYPGEWLMAPHGDLAAAGKFYDPPYAGWHLTVDDDLNYPMDYAERIVTACKQLGGIVSFHGKIVDTPITSYFGDTEKYRVLGTVHATRRIHIPGTGCMAYNVDDVGDAMLWTEMLPPYMVDIHAGRWAARRHIPCWVLEHRAGFITHRDIDHSTTIYERFHKCDTIHTWYVNRTDWPIL